MAYDLQRFKDAQERDYQQALAEIRAGRKRSHWIWYVFPQLQGLGRSPMCARYGIRGMGEAEAYLADETLRGRLVEISRALLELDGNDPVAVMGIRGRTQAPVVHDALLARRRRQPRVPRGARSILWR